MFEVAKEEVQTAQQINIIEKEGDLDFIHDINIVTRGYRAYRQSGLIPPPDAVAHTPESFETDVLKFSKGVARQRGYLIDDGLADES